MSGYTTLLTERTGAVLKITANRPEVLNAQSRILLEELDDAFLRAVDDEAVRVIILAGAGKHFSAGHDLGSPQEMADQKKTALEFRDFLVCQFDPLPLADVMTYLRAREQAGVIRLVRAR